MIYKTSNMVFGQQQSSMRTGKAANKEVSSSVLEEHVKNESARAKYVVVRAP